MKALILAAGYATRLYPLTIDCPKGLLPIGEKTILDYLMAEIATIDEIDEVHLVSNHRFHAHFERWAEGARRRYAPKRLFIWDDGTTSDADKLGAIGDMQYVIERAKIDDDLLVAVSDNLFNFSLRRFIDDFRAHGRDTILAAHLADINLLRRFAVAALDGERRVLELVEKPQEPMTDIGVYALYLYRRDTLPLIRRYLDEKNSPDSPGHLPEWLHKRREVRAYLFEGECVDIGTPESYEEIQRRVAEGTF